MPDKSKTTIGIFVFLFLLTMFLGTVGWYRVLGEDAEGRFADAVYNTLLTFGGEDNYARNPGDPPLDNLLRWARFTGLLTTISALIAVAAVFLGGHFKRAIAGFRRNPQIIIGPSVFAVEFMERRGPSTIFGTEEELQMLPPDLTRWRSLRIPDRLDARTATGRSLGHQPQRILFGDEDSITNVERARIWLDAVPIRRRVNTELVLRIEDNSVARDLSLLSSAFARAHLISRAETIARALVTAMAPTALARLRGQKRVHMVLIGLGSVNLAIAEEFVLRCHHPDQDPLLLTIIDRDASAMKTLRAERPDLLNPEFFAEGPHIRFHQLDGLECCAQETAVKLMECEAQDPITAIVVAAGDDATNTGIAMRLRQMQMEQMAMRAPIFMRNDARTSIAPQPFSDLSGGIVPFGGRVLDDEDVAIEKVYQDLAKWVHDIWFRSQKEKKPEDRWENLSTSGRRASYRAAMSAIETFHAAKLVPPPESPVAGLRVLAAAGNAVLGDDSLILQLSKNEHRRWIAERRAEGYKSSGTGPRDNEKKRHDLMVDFETLPEDEPIKDERNVKEAVNLGIARHLQEPGLPCWRSVCRIGVFGPLIVKDGMLDRLEERFTHFLSETSDIDPKEFAFEILTPNAPGYDRAAAVRLLELIKTVTGRPGRVIVFNTARPQAMDQIAASHIAGMPLEDMERGAREKLMAGLSAQSDALCSASGRYLRMIDCRPLGTSDVELLHDRRRYFESVDQVQNHILALAQVVALETGGEKSDWSRKALQKCREIGLRVL